ncbi:hypothetical protein CCP4SC76_4680002 [Gammaproteobacteria bacterium]
MTEHEKNTALTQTRIDKRLMELIEERLNALVSDMLPNGDLEEHREFHQRALDRQRTQNELREELLKKGVVWAIGSISVVLATQGNGQPLFQDVDLPTNREDNLKWQSFLHSALQLAPGVSFTRGRLRRSWCQECRFSRLGSCSSVYSRPGCHRPLRRAYESLF